MSEEKIKAYVEDNFRILVTLPLLNGDDLPPEQCPRCLTKGGRSITPCNWTYGCGAAYSVFGEWRPFPNHNSKWQPKSECGGLWGERILAMIRARQVADNPYSLVGKRWIARDKKTTGKFAIVFTKDVTQYGRFVELMTESGEKLGGMGIGPFLETYQMTEEQK